MKIKISAQHFLDVTNAMDKVKPFGYVGGQNFLVPFSEVKPIEGYEIPINEKTGKALPFCCNYHRKLYYEIDKWYKNKFPNCCENHKILASNPHFKKIDYKNVAIKVVQQLSYTEHIIRKNIDNIDWYDDITEYIYYNSFSFGHPVSVGNNYYLETLLGMLEDVNFFKSIDERKKDALIKFVKSFYEPIEKVENTDLNLLYFTYQNWLDIFPFELSFFGNLKAHFQNQFPILIGKPQTNRYLGTAKFNVHSKESLIISLLSITDSIITQLNSNNLLENNLLTEPDKIKLEIVVSERKLKTKVGYLPNENDDKRKFADILNEWFADEKKFIDEVTPLIKALPPQPISVNESRTKKVIFETITNIDKQGWQYAFVSEQDYNLFTDLLTNFFEYKPYKLPETIIQLKRTCKTKVAKALGEIHKELSNENKLSTDKKYFELIRVLNHFEKETEGDLYKALTR